MSIFSMQCNTRDCEMEMAPNLNGCSKHHVYQSCALVIDRLQCHPGNVRTYVDSLAAMFLGVQTTSAFIEKCGAYSMNNASTYYNELLPSEKERYDKKLQCLYGPGTYCDPFGISDQHWVDDVLQLTTPVFIPT